MYKRSALAALLLLIACGGPMKYLVNSQPKIPGARANIVARSEKEMGKTDMTVRAEFLPPPVTIGAAYKYFVAWYVPKDKPAVRLGALKYDESSRLGEMNTSVPEMSFKFIVTCEAENQAPTPGADLVFEQQVN